MKSQKLILKDFVIADGASTSGVGKTDGLLLSHIITDAAFDGASFTIQVAPEGTDGVPGTFVTLQDGSGTDITITVALSKACVMPTTPLLPGPWMRFVANAAQSGAATTIKAYFREA